MKKKIIITITLVCMILCSFFVVGNIDSIESPESSKGDQISGPEESKCFEINRVVDGVIDSNHFDTGRYGNAYRDEAGGSYFMVFADLMHDFFGKIFANDNRLCSI